jgi:hypothetical protein
VEISRKSFFCSLVGFKEIQDTDFINIVYLVSCGQWMDLTVISHWENLYLQVDGFKALAK